MKYDPILIKMLRETVPKQFFEDIASVQPINCFNHEMVNQFGVLFYSLFYGFCVETGDNSAVTLNTFLDQYPPQCIDKDVSTLLNDFYKQGDLCL